MHEKSDVNDNECYIKKHHHSKRYLEMRERERERERKEGRNQSIPRDEEEFWMISAADGNTD